MQQALLRVLGGTVANVPPQDGRKHPRQEFRAAPVGTTNILFICSEAARMSASKKVDRAARRGQKSLGFNAR